MDRLIAQNVYAILKVSQLHTFLCMPNTDFERNYTLRSKGGYLPYKNFGNKFNTSFFPYHSKLWNLLPKKIRSSNLSDFKSLIRQEMKPSVSCIHQSVRHCLAWLSTTFLILLGYQNKSNWISFLEEFSLIMKNISQLIFQ